MFAVFGYVGVQAEPKDAVDLHDVAPKFEGSEVFEANWS
jgi:hypothetical protein